MILQPISQGGKIQVPNITSPRVLQPLSKKKKEQSVVAPIQQLKPTSTPSQKAAVSNKGSNWWDQVKQAITNIFQPKQAITTPEIKVNLNQPKPKSSLQPNFTTPNIAPSAQMTSVVQQDIQKVKKVLDAVGIIVSQGVLEPIMTEFPATRNVLQPLTQKARVTPVSPLGITPKALEEFKIPTFLKLINPALGPAENMVNFIGNIAGLNPSIANLILLLAPEVASISGKAFIKKFGYDGISFLANKDLLLKVTSGTATPKEIVQFKLLNETGLLAETGRTKGLSVTEMIPKTGKMWDMLRRIFPDGFTKEGEPIVPKLPKQIEGEIQKMKPVATAVPERAAPTAVTGEVPKVPTVSTKVVSPPSVPVSVQKTAETVKPVTKPSKIAKSIETKAVETKLTKGFEHLAEYTPVTIKAQAKHSTELVNTDFEKARSIIRGETSLPDNVKGVSLIAAMEEHIFKYPDAKLAYELANSPLVTGTSTAAQELRLAAERVPDSLAAKLQEVKQAKKLAMEKRYKKKAPESIKEEIVKIKKEIKVPDKYDWGAFIQTLEC